MDAQQIALSRISDWTHEERQAHQQKEQTTSAYFNTSQQFRKLRHIPMSKLSFNYIFVKKQHEKNFYKKELHPEKVKSVHNYFYELKQNFQEDICAFVKKYKVLDSVSVVDDVEMESSHQLSLSNSESGTPLLTRGFSYEEQLKMNTLQIKRRFPEINTGAPSPVKSKGESRKATEGGYFFNNWRSYEKYFCTKAINSSSVQSNNSEDLAAHLVYAVIDLDYDRGLKIIDKINEINSMKARTMKNLDILSGIKVKDIILEGKGGKKAESKEKDDSPHSHHHSKSSSTKNSKQASLYLVSLRMIIKGLKTLSAVIKLTDELNNNTELAETFFNREKFNLLEDHYLNDPKAKMNLLNLEMDEINTGDLINEYWDGTYDDALNGDQVKEKKKFDKQPSYTLAPNSPKTQPKKIMKSTQNLMSYRNSPKKSKTTDQIKEFLQLPSKYQKICILNNLMFLINFTKKVKISSCQNDYYKLLFSYLKNGQDQLQQVQMQFQMYQQSHIPDTIRTSSSPFQHDDNYSNMSQSSIMHKHHINYTRQVDYIVLLVELREIKIYDRINFATRLLSKAKKVRFVNHLEQKIVKFPYLDNLLLFTKFYKDQISKSYEELVSTHHIREEKPKEEIKRNRKNSSDTTSKYYTQQQLQVTNLSPSKKQRILAKQSIQKNLEVKDILSSKLKTICQNFVDEYGDLSTIAYLSNEYPCLEKFCDEYRESLLLSYEQQEVEKLDLMKEKIFGEQWMDKKTQLPKKCAPFLSQINFRQQKINENAHDDCIEMDLRRCQICSLKVFPDRKECYMECSKCRHGGHLEHLIKWYNSYQNCPNVNCACVCN